MTPVAPQLTTDRLILRQPQASDLPAYTAYCAGLRSRFVGGPFDAPKAFDKFAAITGHWALRGFGRYIMTLGDTPIGHVGPMQLDATEAPELTWTLWDGAHEGHGYATEAATRVRDHLFDDPGWPQLTVYILPDNAGSRAIADRIGATRSDAPAPDWYADALVYHLKAQGAA
ncbi:MAG: GNAT family N-acetyltransferase [Pseudomonadota bacterium]